MLDPQQREGKSIVRQTRQERKRRMGWETQAPPSERDRPVAAVTIFGEAQVKRLEANMWKTRQSLILVNSILVESSLEQQPSTDCLRI